jgi:hypothetical protein
MRLAAGRATNGVDPEGFLIYPALEAALRWQSENLQVPTAEQARELFSVVDHPVGASGDGWNKVVSDIAVEWQRRMYLAPEPEVPDEIKDIGILFDILEPSRMGASAESVKKYGIECYRRGQKAGLK